MCAASVGAEGISNGDLLRSALDWSVPNCMQQELIFCLAVGDALVCSALACCVHVEGRDRFGGVRGRHWPRSGRGQRAARGR